jgi:hypothetical protein
LGDCENPRDTHLPTSILLDGIEVFSIEAGDEHPFTSYLDVDLIGIKNL